MGTLKYLFFFFFLFFSSFTLASGELIYVSGHVWSQLGDKEKKLIQESYLVSIVNPKSFGRILNVQSLNQSTRATHGGAVLGEAIAGAQYIDRSYQSSFDDYSAVGHLGAMILGGLIGSTLDAPATSKYLFRYTVENGDGEVVIQDVTSSEPFHLSTGLCIQLPSIQLQKNQKLCSQTTENVLLEYGRKESVLKLDHVRSPEIEIKNKNSPQDLVKCKLGSLAPTLTTEMKCRAINGVILK